MLNQRPYSVFADIFPDLHPIISLVSSEAVQVARVPAGDLPAELSVVTFLGRTVKVANRLGFCIDQSRRFQRLNLIIRPAAVV